MGFVFRLQSVLNIKKQIEDGLKNDLGKAIIEYENQKEIYNKIEEEKKNYVDSVKTKSQEGISVGDLQKYGNYIGFLNNKAKEQMVNVKNAQDNVDRYREKLIKASQERKIMDKLRKKKYTEYIKGQFKKEQQISEEISNYKYVENLG